MQDRSNGGDQASLSSETASSTTVAVAPFIAKVAARERSLASRMAHVNSYVLQASA